MAIVIWEWESSGSTSSSSRGGPSPFEIAPKAAAGQRDSRPEFSIYLGVNTGPYNTTENGTLILPPIPIEWIVAPRPSNLSSASGASNSSSNGTSNGIEMPACPTRSENLRLFGFTNLIVAALIVFTACRPFIRILTRGVLGAPGRWSKYYTWLISMALTIGSNALVSRLIVTTPGYEHLSMVNVFALYSSRPRVNLVWTAMLRVVMGPITLRGKGRLVQGRKRKVDKGSSAARVVDTERYAGFSWERSGEKPGLGKVAGKPGMGMIPVMRVDRNGSGGWRWEMGTGTGKGAAAVDWWGTYGAGRRLGTHTENETRAESHEDTTPASEGESTSQKKWWRLRRRKTDEEEEIWEPDYREEAEWVYTDSYVATSIAEFVVQLVSAIFIGITWSRFPNEPIREHMKNYYNYMLAAPAMSLVGWVFVPIWRNRTKGAWGGDANGSSGWNVFAFFLFLGLPGFFTYGVAWRYWAEFLLLPGSLWCPPKFVEQAAVWSSFSGLSAFIGSLL